MTANPIPALLDLLTSAGGSPRLTWYGVGTERVELSGHVLVNWANKASNLLLEEFDAEPGTTVGLDLPAHWRLLPWVLGTWQVGAVADLDPHPGAPRGLDVVVTTNPATWDGTGTQVLAVALPALARRYDGVLPPGALDAASSLMTYGDRAPWSPQPDAQALAVAPASGDAGVRYGRLTAWWSDQGPDVPPGSRVLVDVPPEADLPALLAFGTRIWAGKGSVVLREVPAAVAGGPPVHDPAGRDRLRTAERVTADFILGQRDA